MGGGRYLSTVYSVEEAGLNSTAFTSDSEQNDPQWRRKEKESQDSPPLHYIPGTCRLRDAIEGEPGSPLPNAGERFPEHVSQGPSLHVPLPSSHTSSSPNPRKPVLLFPHPSRVKDLKFKGNIGGSLYLGKWLAVE